jgi:hypothetical protein
VNRDQRRVLAVVGGRQIVVENCKSELRNEKQILHLLNYVEENQDRRSEWWKKYGEASGNGHVELPAELQRDDLKEITAQPLLNYLVALSYDRKDKENRLDFSKDITINQIYADILDQVYERVWGKSEGGNVHLKGTRQTIAKSDFIALLEEIGVAV